MWLVKVKLPSIKFAASSTLSGHFYTLNDAARCSSCRKHSPLRFCFTPKGSFQILANSGLQRLHSGLGLKEDRKRLSLYTTSLKLTGKVKNKHFQLILLLKWLPIFKLQWMLSLTISCKTILRQRCRRARGKEMEHS